MAFFFDFAAAFPSIEHQLLMEFFAHLGWPGWLMNFLHCLYQDNCCLISVGGTRYPGFSLTRGVRQGCPISPLLFAACSDFFLRRLNRLFPKTICRAYADDLALVTANGLQHIRRLQAFFSDFERISGLALNIQKTVLVPLDPYEELEIRSAVGQFAPGWSGLVIAAAAKYLGFYIGPGRGELSWEGPMEKFQNRAQQWGSLGAGLFMTLKAFRVYIASVLLFVGQLEELPCSYKSAEITACSMLFPGPQWWMTPDCLRELKTLHLPDELKDVESAVVAAKARVASFENGGCLHVQERARELTALTTRSASCSLRRLAWFGKWRNCSFIFNLNRASGLVENMRRHTPGELFWAQKHGWQKQVARKIYGCQRGLALLHLRKRLDHWNLLTPPGLRVGRALNRLETIANACQPRVLAAYLRLLCNGWCTHSRFGRRGKCRMNCGASEDSIHHLAHCQVVKQLFYSCAGIGPPATYRALDDFLGLANHQDGKEEVLQRARATYALYRTFNSLRHGTLDMDELPGAFDGFLREAL